MKIPFLNIVDEDGNLDVPRVILMGLVILIVTTILSFAAARLSHILDVETQNMQVNDPDRVQDLRTQVLNRYHALEGQVASIDALRTQRTDLVAGLGERSTWPLDVADQYNQLGTQISQLESAYSQSCSDYQAFIDDPSRNVALPTDLSRECPELKAA